MNETQRLIELALHRLWVGEICIDPDGGEVTFNVGPLDESLKSTCRLAAKGIPVTWAPFVLCDSPEEANAACDVLLDHIRRIAKQNGRRVRSTEEILARLMRRSAWRWGNQQQKNEPNNEIENDKVASADLVAATSDDEHWEH